MALKTAAEATALQKKKEAADVEQRLREATSPTS